MQRMLGYRRSFPVLLYLEWVLLAIALVIVLSPRPPMGTHHPEPGEFLSYLQGGLNAPPNLAIALFCITLLLITGIRLPTGATWRKSLFVLFWFGLCWVTMLTAPRREVMFPVLLLMVVIRACLLFPKRGRFVVAGFAYAAFLGMLWLTPPPIRPFHGGVLPNGNGQPISLEQWHSAVFNLSLNSALLFGFVLLFVLLLVGALLAEHQSREELAAANQRLLHYSLLIENQATLQERSRIAREIHDSVGHALTAQSIQLENAQMFLQTDLSQTAKHLEEARSLGRTALKDVRQSVSALRTDPLQGKSLAIALQHLIQDFQKTTQIPVRSQIQLPVDVPADFSRMLYRIIQEALTNVAKHSDATQVWLSLTQAPTHLDLCIHDNGRGFDPAQNSTGFGLQSIQERTEAIGGYLALDSAVGQGCQLQIRIPFR